MIARKHRKHALKRGREGPRHARWRIDARLFWPCLLLLPPLLALLSPLPQGLATEPLRLAIAVVKSRSLPPYSAALEGFERALLAENFRPYLVTHDLAGDASKAANVASILRRSPPDLVLTLGSLATVALEEAMKKSHPPSTSPPPSVPMVFAMVLEPDANGLAAAGKTTGRPITGVSMDISPRLQLEALRQVLPQTRRVGILYNPIESAKTVQEAAMAAQALGLTLETELVRTEREVPRAFDALSPRVDVLMAIPDATVYTESSTPYLLLQALRQSQPFVGLLESFVRAGALMSLSIDYTHIGKQAGHLAARVAKGEAPGTLPVEAPTGTRLLLNLRTAQRIGVTIPPEVMSHAEVLVK